MNLLFSIIAVSSVTFFNIESSLGEKLDIQNLSESDDLLKISENCSQTSPWLNEVESSMINSNQNLDWRDRGALTPVKNQFGCGSSYAFAAVEAIEAQYYIKTKSLLSLSEQQVVDCSKRFGNDGCQDGFIDQTYRYIRQQGGLMLETDYSYTGHTSTQCQFTRNKKLVKIAGFRKIPVSEAALFNAVTKIGPVAVVLNYKDSLRMYTKGIYSDPDCFTDQRQAVLVVGYGNENGTDYWIIKNSWGIDWGEKGYFRMIRNEDMCDVANRAYIPTSVRLKKSEDIKFFMKLVVT